MLDGMVPGVKVKDQFERRRNWRARDEYGRLWESTVDTESGGTCAPINPRGWDDPISTPQKYLIKALSADPETGNLGIRVAPALEAWVADLEVSHQEYDTRLYNDAMMLFGAQGPDAYAKRAPELLNYTGVGPQAIEPVIAALEGDPWALGLPDAEDTLGLAKYFPKKETAREKFVREMKEKQGDKFEERLDIEDEADPLPRAKKAPKKAVA